MPALAAAPVAYPDAVGPPPLSATELREWRGRLGLTQERLAQELGVTFTTVWRWEKGVQAIPPMLRLALQQIEQQRPKP